MKYLTVEDESNFYYLDIETDGLSPTKIWCVIIKCKGTKQVWKFINDGSSNLYHDVRQFFLKRSTAVYCAHYGLSFDGPWLGHFCGFDFPYNRTVDTVVLSYLYDPALSIPAGLVIQNNERRERKGGHSLEAYGFRLGFPKVTHEDWGKFSPEMLRRCEMDVDLLEMTHDALLKRMTDVGFSDFSCQIEHKIRVITDKQEKNGFYFHKDKAENLVKFLGKRKEELSEPIQKLFPPRLEKVKTYERKYKADGSDYASYLRHLEVFDRLEDNEDGTYTVYSKKAFNISSSKQRLERLLELSYEPTAKTKKGNPRIDEDSLLEYAKECNRPEIKAIAEYLVTAGRMSMISGNPETGTKGWLGWYNEETHRIHGKVFTCGATSRRMTHNSPNLANIPSPQNGAMYGEECRSCWGVAPGLDRVLVGYDAKGLETHVMCHFLNSLKANQLLLEGDVHESNQKALQKALDALLSPGWGTVVRGGGGAKTAMYAAIYGAYPPKLGSIFKQGKVAGEVVQKVLYNNVPGLGKAVKAAQDEWRHNKGLIRCIDGGFVRCPSESAAFNYKIQPNGGILMKLTSIFLDKRLKEKGLWHMKVADVHDEGQHETDRKSSEELGRMSVQAITDAGETLGFNIRMTGNYKIGDTWAQTH